jgi:pyruvate kinase
MVKQVDQWLIEHGEAQIGDIVIIVAGAPPGIPGSTNALRVHQIGDAVSGRAAAYR